MMKTFTLGNYWWLVRLGLLETIKINLGTDTRNWHINEEK